MKLNQVTVGAIDYETSVAFYKWLGLRQIVASPPRYARFETPTGETFSLHQVDEATRSTTIVYFEVDDVDAFLAALDLPAAQAVNQPWLWREARLRDPACNEVCIYHAGENRRFPPWRVE